MVLKLLYIITFLDVLVMALVMPLNSIHMIELGASRFTHGVFSSMRSLFQLIFGPLIGSLSDTKGRKPLLIVTGVGLLLSNVLLLPQYLSVYFVSRMVYGGMSHIPLLIKTIVADVSNSEQQTSILGKVGALSGVGFIIGPVIGGHVKSWDDGFYYVSLLLIFLSVTTIGFSLLLQETKPKTGTKIKQKAPPKDMKTAFRNLASLDWSTYWDVFAMKCLAEIGITTFFQMFMLTSIEVYQVSSKNLGYMIATISFMGIVTSLSIGKIKEKFYSTDIHYKKRNLHGLLAFTATFLSLHIHSSLAMYYFAALSTASLKNLLDTTWNEMIVARTNADNRGKVMGAFEAMLQFASLITPLMGGYVSEKYGPATAVKLCVFPLIAASILTIKIKEVKTVKTN